MPVVNALLSFVFGKEFVMLESRRSRNYRQLSDILLPFNIRVSILGRRAQGVISLHI
jgi:hypothetical protein